VGSVLRIRRRHVLLAMSRARVPDAERVTGAMYASLGAGLLELLWLAGRRPADLDRVAVFTGRAGSRLNAAASQGRGIVIATAHTGNWDLAACATARWLGREAAPGSRLSVVTRRLSWRALDRYWQALRAERGVDLIDGTGGDALPLIRAALAAGGAVALLTDQVPVRAAAGARSSRGSVTLPFLGAPALHDLGPAILAARARAPIAVAFAHRDVDGRHVMDVLDVLPAPRDRAEIVEATARIARALETFVRAHPEQWLWLHRRWKTSERAGRPEGGRQIAAPIDRGGRAHAPEPE
jgi:Kdo2-lipid IVA lauroyltransferase/acyltransferase